MRHAPIFISYRRDDAAGYARAIYSALAQSLGAEQVFMDVDDIGVGQAFGEVLAQAVAGSQVLLVLIGRRWLGERPGGAPRIHEPADWVQQEVAAGLAAGKRVIPLLLDGATMPDAAQLPEPLRALAGRNALTIDNTRFAADIERLVAVLREALARPTPARPAPARRVAAAVALAGVLLAAVLLWPAHGPGGPVGSARPASAAAASSPAAAPLPDGVWQAEISYDWPNAQYSERFVFATEGSELRGSASFLRVPRGLLEGRSDAQGLRFITRSGELLGAAISQDTVHRYRGRWVGETLHFVMQTEGGSSPHAPVEFVARRVLAAAAPTAAPAAAPPSR